MMLVIEVVALHGRMGLGLVDQIRSFHHQQITKQDMGSGDLRVQLFTILGRLLPPAQYRATIEGGTRCRDRSAP